MNTIRITTTQNIELEYDLASLGERILGRLLDGVILFAYAVIAALFFVWSDMVDDLMWVMILVVAIPIVFYDLACEVFMNGQSIGKRVMNIKVISLDGAQPSLGQYIIRWVFRMIDFTMTSSLCALISVAVSEKKQRVGDMVAGTTLIKTIPRTDFQQTIYVPTEQANYQLSFPEVHNLSDQDMQLIKEVINTVNRTGNTMLAVQAADRIKETLGIRSDMEPLTFLQVVLADYNYSTSERVS
jgi:uncharacterized RDD family membrane protein YckC